MINLDLADAMASKTGITREQGLAAIKAMTDAIAGALKAGETVELRGFGTFKYVTRTVTGDVARPGHEAITIEQRDVAFRPGVILSRVVAEG